MTLNKHGPGKSPPTGVQDCHMGLLFSNGPPHGIESIPKLLPLCSFCRADGGSTPFAKPSRNLSNVLPIASG